MLALTLGIIVVLAELIPTVFSATFTPKLVSVTNNPFVSVVVTAVVLVVSAEQAVQLVHCGSEDNIPLVQPGQEKSGQSLPFHQEVHDPLVHGPDVQYPGEPPLRNAPLLHGLLSYLLG